MWPTFGLDDLYPLGFVPAGKSPPFLSVPPENKSEEEFKEMSDVHKHTQYRFYRLLIKEKGFSEHYGFSKLAVHGSNLLSGT